MSQIRRSLAAILFIVPSLAHAAKLDMAKFEEAVLSGDVQVAQQQVALGAPVDSPFLIPKEKGESLRETPLMIAALNARVEMVRFLISRKADVNKLSDIGSPLMYAAMCTAFGEPAERNRRLPADSADCFKVSELLLKAGASKLLQTKSGETAADIAKKMSNRKLARMLSSK